MKRSTDSLWVYIICLSSLRTCKEHRQAFVSHTTSFIYSDLPPYVFCRIALFSMPLLPQLDPALLRALPAGFLWGLFSVTMTLHSDIMSQTRSSALFFLTDTISDPWKVKNGGTILFCLFFTLEGICWGSTNPRASSMLGTYLMTELYPRNIYSLKTTKNFEDFSLCGVLLFYNSSF